MGHSQTTFWQDNLEDASLTTMGGGTRTPSTSFLAGISRYFSRVSTANISTGTPYSGFEGSYFWAGEDIDYLTAQGSQSFRQNVTWTGISISGRNNLSFKGLFATGTGTTFDQGSATTATDHLVVEYRIDGGTWKESLRFFPNIANTATGALALETTGDSLGDGATLNAAFTEYAFNITGTGTTLDIRARFSSNGSTEEIAIDNFRVLETVASPTITTTGTLTAFSNCSGTPSSPQSFTVSATTLSNNLSIAAPTGFEISTSSGGTYSATLSLTPTSGTVASTSIFVRTTAAATGSPSGNVTISSTGATSKTVAVTGTVTTSVTPSVTISSTDADNTICAGTSVTFSASITNGGTTPAYQWKINGNNVNTATAATFTTATLANNDVVTCVLTANATCTSTSTVTSTGITTVVNANVNPLVSISTGNNPTCASSSVTITATAINGGSTPSFQWMVNGTNVGTASSSNKFISTSLANNDVVTVLLVSNALCASPINALSSGITMTVNPAVTPSVSISIPKTTICMGTSATFTAAPINGGTTPAYQWKVNGNNISTATAATFTTTTLANNDAVTCVLTSNATCASSSTVTSPGITMKVNALPTALASASPKAICQGDTSILSVAFTGTGPWSFTVSDGTNATSAVSPNSTLLIPVAPTSTKTYTLASISDANCTGVAGDTAKLTVKNPSTHTQSISLCAGESVKVGKKIYTKSGNYTDILVAANGCDSTVITNLTVAPIIDSTVAVLGATLTANEAGASYQWKSCTSNQNISGAISQSYIAVNNGQYAVIVTKGTCSKTSACVTILVTGIDDNNVSNATLSVYPNPSNGSITISANAEGTYKLQDELGQLTETFNLNAANEFSITREDLEAGVYILSGFNNNRMTTQKIVVVR